MAPYSRAIGAAGTRMATYPAISTVAAREMRRASFLARPSRSARHSGHSSPQRNPLIRRSHLAQGTSGSPLSDGTADLLRARGAAQVSGPDAVTHNGGDDSLADPMGPLQLADVVQHHGG